MTAVVRWTLRSASGRTPSGYVRFTPSSIRTGGTPPETVLPDPVTVSVMPVPGESNSGVVVATLDATDAPGYAPASWAWKCEPVGFASAPAPFMFYAPDGSTVDLATVVKVSAAPVNTTGGAGVASVAVDGGDLVVTMAEGAVTRYPLPSASGGLSREDVQGIARTVAQAVVSEYVTTTPPSAPAFPQGKTPLPSTPARRAIILGDSHSDWFWPQSGGVWWWQVAADLAGVTIVDNVAVGGMTTAHALHGWSADTDHPDVPQIEQAEASDADLAILEFGGNDVAAGMSEADFRKNLTEIVQRLQRSGKRVIVTAPPPLFADFNASTGAPYARFRAIDREVADATGAYYSDAWDKVGTAAGGALPGRYDSGDGVHMNGDGQLACGLALAPAIRAFAAVPDPFKLDGAKPWWETAMGHTFSIAPETGPADELFHGAPTAVITPGPQEGEDTIIFTQVSAVAGTVWEVAYPYRMEGPTYPGTRITEALADWPAGTQTDLVGQLRLVGQEGIRRHEITIPPEATEGRVFALRVPRYSGDTKIRVGGLVLRQLK